MRRCRNVAPTREQRLDISRPQLEPIQEQVLLLVECGYCGGDLFIPVDAEQETYSVDDIENTATFQLHLKSCTGIGDKNGFNIG